MKKWMFKVGITLVAIVVCLFVGFGDTQPQKAGATPAQFTSYNNCSGAGINPIWEGYHLNRSQWGNNRVQWSNPYELETAHLELHVRWQWPGGNWDETSDSETFTEPAYCLQERPDPTPTPEPPVTPEPPEEPGCPEKNCPPAADLVCITYLGGDLIRLVDNISGQSVGFSAIRDAETSATRIEIFDGHYNQSELTMTLSNGEVLGLQMIPDFGVVYGTPGQPGYWFQTNCARRNHGGEPIDPSYIGIAERQKPDC